MDGPIAGTDIPTDQAGRAYKATQTYTTIFAPLAAQGSGSNRTPYLHNEAIYVVFMDGTVRSVSLSEGQNVLGGGGGTQRHPFWGAGVTGSPPSGHPLSPNQP